MSARAKAWVVCGSLILVLLMTAFVRFAVRRTQTRKAVACFRHAVSEAESDIGRLQCHGLHSLLVARFPFDEPIRAHPGRGRGEGTLTVTVADCGFSCWFAGRGKEQTVNMHDHVNSLRRALPQYEDGLSAAEGQVRLAPAPPELAAAKKQWLEAAESCVASVRVVLASTRRLEETLNSRKKRGRASRRSANDLCVAVADLLKCEQAVFDAKEARAAAVDALWKGSS